MHTRKQNNGMHYIENCTNKITHRKYNMCDKHSNRMKRHGDPHIVKRVEREPIGFCLTCHIDLKDKVFCSRKCADRASHIASAYGIQIEQYNEMLDKQNGLCEICKFTMEKICIDHNHETGHVRALLCGNCNLLLGMAHEDAWILQRAANYILNFNLGKEVVSPEMIADITFLDTW